jgi:hypothetical protein
MATCNVYIWKLLGDKAYHMVGLAHAGLRLVTRAHFDYYITLYNRSWAKKNGFRQGIFPSQKTEAHMDIGFSQIKNRGGNIIDNPSARGTEPRPSHRTVDYQADKNNHGRAKDAYEPDDFSRVPIAFDGDNLFGVSDTRIETFWKDVLNADPGHSKRRYALFSKHNNCCGVVTDALIEGGLDFYEPPPSNLVYQDARTLFKWVEKAKARIDRMNEEYARFKSLILAETDDIIPTYEQWKTRSELGVGFFASRKMQIAFIDDYIKAYHLAVKKNDTAAQVRSLIRIQFQAFDHLAKKPNSDRRSAVVWLVARVRNALKRLSKQYEKAPPVTNFEQQPDIKQLPEHSDSCHTSLSEGY